MARSTQSPSSRPGAALVPASSRFNQRVRSEGAYDYWASGSQPGSDRRRRGRRSAPLAQNILAPQGKPPGYYALVWQILLWLAFALLALILMFG